MAWYTNAQIEPDREIVCDLSNLAPALLEGLDISAALSDEQETKLVEFVRACFSMSHDRISQRYSHWQAADRAHDVYVPADATRFREKLVMADTRAIADTVLTYIMAAITGRNPTFQLEGLNRRSRKSAAIVERVLHQQMRRRGDEVRLAQLFLDSIRYGFSPTKITWDGKARSNILTNFNPRRVFPDPRVQWGNWAAAQFIGCYDWFSYDSLVQTGLYPKLKQFPALRNPRQRTGDGWKYHGWSQEAGRGLSINPAQKTSLLGNNTFSLGDARPCDELWVRLAGYQLNLPGIDSIYLVINVLDEDVCIRCQANPGGMQYPWVIGSLYQDLHKHYGQGLYDLLLPLHDLATWLLRSRVDNVQAALNNLIFVDPEAVSIVDLINRNPYGVVRTLPGTKPGEGIHIAQIPDVTRGHWSDIGMLSDLKQRVSAASDAQQGMPTASVRTATEVSRLSQLGSQRLGVLSRILSATTVRPMAGMMVNNIQDAILLEGSIKVNPDSAPGLLSPLIKEDYLDFSIADLQGEIDYLVVDGTLPIEPTRSPETWMNILSVANQAGLGMELDLKRVALEGIRSMGVSDIDQYRISPEQAQQGPSPSQQLQLMEKMRGASVMPEEQLDREIDKGNLVPMSEAA